MKTEFVSIKNAVQDFLQDLKIRHEEVDENLLIKWAADCSKWFHTDQQLRHRVLILQIENSRARLPDDYSILAQAAANPIIRPKCDCTKEPDSPCCTEIRNPRAKGRPKTRIEEVSQWVASSLKEECHLEINVICPKCHKDKCSCGMNAIEIDVDRLWEMSHPEYYYKHFTKVGRFGNGPGTDSFYTPKFQLMRYSTNDFFNIKNILTECPNVNCKDCSNEFIISLPYIEVDFQEGEVLLSYLGKMLDGDGEIMIPDHPDAHEAIQAHLRYKWYLAEGTRLRDSFLINLSNQALSRRDEHIGYARASLEIPSAQEWKSWLQNSSWLKRIPNWQSDNAGKYIKDQYKNYLK